MKITKDTGISIGALAVILPLAFWFFTKKADVTYVEKVETKIEETKEEVDQEENINIQQTEAIKQIQENQRLFIKEFKELQQAK